MKTKISILLLLFVGCIYGCSVIGKMKDKKINNDFSVVHNVVNYKGKPFAELQAMTFSLDNGDLVREMNFKLLNDDDLNLIGDMINYLSDRHQGDEIEIEVNVEHNSERFKL